MSAAKFLNAFRNLFVNQDKEPLASVLADGFAFTGHTSSGSMQREELTEYGSQQRLVQYFAPY